MCKKTARRVAIGLLVIWTIAIFLTGFFSAFEKINVQIMQKQGMYCERKMPVKLLALTLFFFLPVGWLVSISARYAEMEILSKIMKLMVFFLAIVLILGILTEFTKV